MKNRFDALIIGGGPGGLTIASLLAKEGISSAIIEKEPELGGRYRSINFHGCRSDNGVRMPTAMKRLACCGGCTASMRSAGCSAGGCSSWPAPSSSAMRTVRSGGLAITSSSEQLSPDVAARQLHRLSNRVARLRAECGGRTPFDRDGHRAARGRTPGLCPIRQATASG